LPPSLRATQRRALLADRSLFAGAAPSNASRALGAIGGRFEALSVSKRRFEILGRQVFSRLKALLMEPTVFAFAERHDNIEAIYKKLTERRVTSDVTGLLKELHRIASRNRVEDARAEEHFNGI
jgi:type I restriction enzyme, R subunit